MNNRFNNIHHCIAYHRDRWCSDLWELALLINILLAFSGLVFTISSVVLKVMS